MLLRGINLLFERNPAKSYCKKYIHLSNMQLVIDLSKRSRNTFSGDDLLKIIQCINYIRCGRKYPHNIPIIINVGRCEFLDKLVYILLECAMSYVVENLKLRVSIDITSEKTIKTEGIDNSPLRFLISGKTDYERFCRSFSFELNMHHYRRLMLYDNSQEIVASNTYMETHAFLVNNFIDESTSDELSEMIAEIVGNALEHCHTDCLLDIDIANNYINGYTRRDCYGINVALVNFSETAFYKKLKDKMQQTGLPERYDDITRAFKVHSKSFGEDYDEDEFYMVASFQHRISGSMNKVGTGGVGLTKLIRSVEEKAENHMCYILTNNIIMGFNPKYMKRNGNFVGFNKENNFMQYPPESGLFEKINTVLPGTGYNLNFVINKE